GIIILDTLQVHGTVAVGVHAVHGVAFIQAIQTGVRGNMSIFPCKCASSSGVIHIGNRIICIPAAEVAVTLSTIDGVHSHGSLGAIHVDQGGLGIAGSALDPDHILQHGIVGGDAGYTDQVVVLIHPPVEVL